MSGETAVHVKYGSQELDLPIIVTKGKGVPLMARDWLSKIKLNWHQINAVRQANQAKPKLEDIVQQYPKLFDGKLGTFTGFKAELKVKRMLHLSISSLILCLMHSEGKWKMNLSAWCKRGC